MEKMKRLWRLLAERQELNKEVAPLRSWLLAEIREVDRWPQPMFWQVPGHGYVRVDWVPRLSAVEVLYNEREAEEVADFLRRVEEAGND